MIFTCRNFVGINLCVRYRSCYFIAIINHEYEVNPTPGTESSVIESLKKPKGIFGSFRASGRSWSFLPARWWAIRIVVKTNFDVVVAATKCWRVERLTRDPGPRLKPRKSKHLVQVSERSKIEPPSQIASCQKRLIENHFNRFPKNADNSSLKKK